MTATAPSRIPVSLVTGFLGSGKTTLIASLLRRHEMAGTAIMVNEFGAVGIDDLVLGDAAGQRDGIVLLRNGCICCAVGDALGDGLLTLARREERPRRIIVEATGLADPVPLLAKVMSDLRLRGVIRIDGVIATIDPTNRCTGLDANELLARHAAVADRRVITKADLVSPALIEEVRRALFAANAGAGVLVATNGDVGPDDLFGAGLMSSSGELDPARWLSASAFRAMPTNDGTVAAHLIEEDRGPLRWSTFSARVEDLIVAPSAPILRLKGMVHTDDDPRPLIMHGVRSVFHRPLRLSHWPDDRCRTQIVVIIEGESGHVLDRLRAAVSTSCIPA